MLVQGVSSGERMEFTIRKAVELGVAEIRPVLAAASVARPKGERAAQRQAHWQKIAVSACEQCGRNTIPAIHPLQDLPFVSTDKSFKVLLTPRADAAFSRIISGEAKSYAIAAGPEAGFDAREEASFVEAGFVPAKLGPRILRTETAALAALAALSALRGDF
jgi:16S rRNA (uracil1498-N3)-methyltransferase